VSSANLPSHPLTSFITGLMFRPVDLGRLCAQLHLSARDTFLLATSGFLQKRTKGALAAVCTPTLKSASKKHQKLYTSASEHHEWHSEGGQKKLCIVYIFSFLQTILL